MSNQTREDQLWVRGWLSGQFSLPADDKESFEWAERFSSKPILERDVPALGPRISSRDSPSILADAGSQSGANAECRTVWRADLG